MGLVLLALEFDGRFCTSFGFGDCGITSGEGEVMEVRLGDGEAAISVDGGRLFVSESAGFVVCSLDNCDSREGDGDEGVKEAVGLKSLFAEGWSIFDGDASGRSVEGEGLSSVESELGKGETDGEMDDDKGCLNERLR